MRNISTLKPGFTLIELVVTMAIISVAFGIMFSSYSAAQRNTRDAQRKSDLRSLQGALEQYKADQLYYPNGTLPAVGSPLTSGSRTYLNKIPGDPVTSAAYTYAALPSGCNNTSTLCLNYCLSATLDNAPNPQPSYTACGSPPSPKTFFVTAP